VVGGAIAFVEEGDTITIDADQRLLTYIIGFECRIRSNVALTGNRVKPRYTTGVRCKICQYLPAVSK